MKQIPKRILILGCIALCALNLAFCLPGLRKGVQHIADADAVSVYPAHAEVADYAVRVQRTESSEANRVVVYIRHSYDDRIVQRVVVPNLYVLGLTIALYLTAERMQRQKRRAEPGATDNPGDAQ